LKRIFSVTVKKQDHPANEYLGFRMTGLLGYEGHGAAKPRPKKSTAEPRRTLRESLYKYSLFSAFLCGLI
jgi:hypothetical protein